MRFLGAAGTVTGSKYLVSNGEKNILVDCGLFQGPRVWRERNWDSPSVNCSTIDATLITHAHIDHTGMLPRYYNFGIKCPIYASSATHELSRLLLIDSAKLQEEEASYRSRHHRSRHNPPLPLYTEEDAVGVLKLFKSVGFNKSIELFPGISATWRRMGHILGAASITLEISGKKISFSGDIGRYSVPILCDPEPIEFGDLLLIESTYGTRSHSDTHPSLPLAKVVNETYSRGGAVIIPSFAVGRTQEILFHIRELKESNKIPNLPVVVDSPMASDATEIYSRFTDCYDEEARKILVGGKKPFKPTELHFVRDRAESIKLNSIDHPMILISASGMLSGGRILHHLFHRISDPRNTVLFVGYQPPGSRGDWIKSGATSMTLLGEEIPIRAKVEEISGLSAHADKDELLRWCRACTGTPGKVAIVHGEPESAVGFSETLEKELGWNTLIPKYLDTISI